jgi:uncharacterized LabA/DUF88 family protein
MQKVIIFIDGENFIRGALSNFFDARKMPKKFTHNFFKENFDFQGFFEFLVDTSYQKLIEIKYYDARLNIHFSNDHRKKQRQFFKTLEESGIILELGKLKGDPRNGEVKQKGVDTKLAIDLVTYGVDKKYDVGFLVSSDWDFGPAVNFLKTKNKDVNYVYFHNGFCKVLLDSCKHSKKITWKQIKKFCTDDLKKCKKQKL